MGELQKQSEVDPNLMTFSSREKSKMFLTSGGLDSPQPTGCPLGRAAACAKDVSALRLGVTGKKGAEQDTRPLPPAFLYDTGKGAGPRGARGSQTARVWL